MADMVMPEPVTMPSLKRIPQDIVEEIFKQVDKARGFAISRLARSRRVEDWLDDSDSIQPLRFFCLTRYLRNSVCASDGGDSSSSQAVPEGERLRIGDVLANIIEYLSENCK
jgi:hypothetical protein